MMHMRRNLRVRLFGSAFILAAVCGYGLLARMSREEWGLSKWSAGYAGIAILGMLCALLIVYQTHAVLARSLQVVHAALAAMREGQFAHIDEVGLPIELHALAQAYNTTSDSLAARQHELHNQLRSTALLTRLSIELRASLDPAIIVHDTLSIISAHTDAGAAAIVLLGPDGAIEAAHTSAAGQVRPVPSEQARRALERGLTGWVLRHGGSVVLADAAHDQRWNDFDDAEPAGSVMALPLTHRRATFGVLTITHPAPGHFTGQDLLLLEGVAAQAGVALSAARRHLDERRRRDQALLLLSIGQFLASERTAADLAAELLEKSAAVFDACSTALFLADPGAEALTCFATHAGPVPEWGAQAHNLAEHMAAVAERAWLTRTPTSDSRPDGAAPADSPLQAREGLACVALPLLHNGDAIGAFVLARAVRGTAVFAANTWAMLTIFANIVAGAFANLRLIDQLHMRAETLEQQMREQTVQLKLSRDLLRIIFDHLPDGLVLIDADGRILTANDAFCEDVLGVPPRAAVGRNYAAIMRDLERDAQIMIEPHPSAPAMRRARCAAAGERQRWYEIDRYIVESDGEGVEQVVERWRAVTRQDDPHREPPTSMARLAASVVHEVGNPLQSVRSCIDLCREDSTLAAPTADYLELASSELKRMSHSLGRLRELYRLPLSEATDEQSNAITRR